MPRAAPTQTDPRSWTAASIDDRSRWYLPLPETIARELDELVPAARREARPAVEVTLPAGTRARWRQALAPAIAALEEGRGFFVLEGLPQDRYSDADAVLAYWLIGQALGEPFAQNVQGTLLYDVKDTGQTVTQGARFSVTNADTSYHTDNSFGDSALDYVGLLCLRAARSGGMNQVVSGLAACEELRTRHPQTLAMLQEPYHVDRRGGVRPGEAPTAHFPILEWRSGELLVRYLRFWIHAGHEKIGVPLSAGQIAALDTFDDVLQEPELRAEFTLAPRQLFFINNRWILHNRTAFDDYEEPELRRHLVRLWIQRAA